MHFQHFIFRVSLPEPLCIIAQDQGYLWVWDDMADKHAD